MAIKMQIRRGTATAWASANPLLVAGELGFVTDAGKTAFKIGNNTDLWNDLAYVNSTYPELDVSAGNNLNTSLAQGRYPLLSGSSYTNAPGDFTNTTTDGSSILLVTVPTNNIIIQELTTSLTPCKRWIRAYNAVWTAWKRIDTLSASESLSITNLTLTGKLFVPPGSAAAPSITITGDTTTGIYQSAAQEIGIATNGVNRLKIGNSALTSTTTFSAVGVSAGASGLTSSGGIGVSGGTTALKGTTVDGGLTVSSGNTSLVSLSCSSTATGITPTTANHFATKSYVDDNVLYPYIDVIDSATASSPTSIAISTGVDPPDLSPFNSRSTVTIGETYWYKAQIIGNANSSLRDGILRISYLTPSNYDYELIIGARSQGLRFSSPFAGNGVFTLETSSIITAQSNTANQVTTGVDITVGNGGGNTLVKYFWYGVRVLGPADRPGMTV